MRMWFRVSLNRKFFMLLKEDTKGSQLVFFGNRRFSAIFKNSEVPIGFKQEQLVLKTFCEHRGPP